MRYGDWLAAAAVALTMAASAEAQPLIILPDRMAIGGSLGLSSNADENSEDRSPDVSALLELPFFQPYRVRLDAGRVTWRFGGTRRDTRVPDPSDVSLTRATVTLVKMVSPARLGVPLAVFAGGGVGLYRYSFGPGRRAVVRSGLHLLGGFEYTLPSDRVAITWEAQLHGVGGPGASPVPASAVLALQGSVGLKYRF